MSALVLVGLALGLLGLAFTRLQVPYELAVACLIVGCGLLVVAGVMGLRRLFGRGDDNKRKPPPPPASPQDRYVLTTSSWLPLEKPPRPHLVIDGLEQLPAAIVGHAGDNRQTGVMYALAVRNDPPEGIEPVVAEDVRGDAAIFDMNGNQRSNWWHMRWTDKNPHSQERKFDPATDDEELVRPIKPTGLAHRLLLIAHYTRRGDFYLWSLQGTAHQLWDDDREFRLLVRLRSTNTERLTAAFKCRAKPAHLEWEQMEVD